MVRFTNSGSEAVGTAVRLARAYTGRRLVIRFEGHYHGWQDIVYWSNHVDPAAAGPASQPAAGPVRAPASRRAGRHAHRADLERRRELQRVMAERGDEMAAVITEPVMFNTGCILPEPGYLELLRRRPRQHGALLIFDEVITGFRFAGAGPGVVRGHAGPHDAGQGPRRRVPRRGDRRQREVMCMIAEGRYSHSGTYNANVVACAAVSATMDVLAEPGLFERQRALGEACAGPAQAGRRRGPAGDRRGARHRVPAVVHRPPHPQLARRAALRRRDLFTRWWQEMLLRGVLFHPSQYENLFVSLVHSSDDVSHTLEAAAQALPWSQAAQLGVADPLWCSILAATVRCAADVRGRPAAAGSGLLYSRWSRTSCS